MDEEPRPLEIEITVDLARILDEAKISYIYTGWTSMFCYVGPNICGDLTYAIPDELVDSAKDAIITASTKYVLCTRDTCMEREEERTTHPEFRFCDWQLGKHPKPVYHFDVTHRVIVYLVRQSDLFPWVPATSMTPGQPSKDDPYVTISTSQDLPFPGPWLGLHPVRVLNTTAFIQALIYLWMRDYQRYPETRLWMLWERWMSIMKRIPESEEPLQGEFQRAWDYYRGNYPKTLDILLPPPGLRPSKLGLLQLREKLIKEGKFLLELPKIVLPDIKDLDEM